MGNITPNNTLTFKSAKSTIARIQSNLESFDSAGLINPSTFYKDIKYILMDKLGIGVFKEEQAVLNVKNYKTALPLDFYLLYSAYKCTPSVETGTDVTYPQSGFVYYLERTDSEVHYDKCEIESTQSGKVVDKITVREYYKGKTNITNFNSPILLRLSSRVKKDICTKDCLNYYAGGIDEISIDNGYIYSNFTDDSIYIKYFAFPLDEDGLPLIPEIEAVEKVLEYYLMFRIFENIWLNDLSPDVEKRMVYIKAQYEEALINAKYYVKLPTLSTLGRMVEHNKHRFDNYQLIRF